MSTSFSGRGEPPPVPSPPCPPWPLDELVLDAVDDELALARLGIPRNEPHRSAPASSRVEADDIERQLVALELRS